MAAALMTTTTSEQGLHRHQWGTPLAVFEAYSKTSWKRVQCLLYLDPAQAAARYWGAIGVERSSYVKQPLSPEQVFDAVVSRTLSWHGSAHLSDPAQIRTRIAAQWHDDEVAVADWGSLPGRSSGAIFAVIP